VAMCFVAMDAKIRDHISNAACGQGSPSAQHTWATPAKWKRIKLGYSTN